MKNLLLLILLVSGLAHASLLPKEFIKTVASAGTPECLVISSDDTTSTDVAVQALASNTGIVFYGGTGLGAGEGLQLLAGQVATFSGVQAKGTDQVFLLKNICIDVSVSAEGVNVTYFEVVVP